MTIKMPRNLMTAISVVAFAVLLHGCGGGGGGSPVATMDDDTTTTPDDTTMAGPMIAGKTVPSGTTVTLPAGTDLPKVTFSGDMGETITVPDIGTFTCVDAGGCSVAAAGDTVTTSGNIEVVSLAITDADILTQLAAAVAAGEAPKPVAVDLAALTAGYVLAAGTIEIPAGGTVIHGDVALTCTGSEACTVTIADDGTVTSLGGACTAANSPLYVARLEAARLEMEAADALVAVQTDAATAATAAKTAADNAASSATAATEAGANLATIQTGETSRGLATKAGEQAALAQAAYTVAKTASDAAAAATDITSALRAQINAENALADAMDAETKAGEYSQMAMDAADNELMIEGTVKTVGGTSLDAEAGSLVKKVGTGTDEQTTKTGLIEDKNPAAMMVGAVGGVEFVPDTANTPEDETVAHVQAVAARTFDIGKVVDSADDMARLMIVTQYAGTKTVKVYATASGAVVMGTLRSDGRIQTAGVTAPGATDDPTDDRFVTLKSIGTYYLAGLAADVDGLTFGDEVGSETKGTQVFSFVDDMGTPDDATDDPTGYVVLGETTTKADGTAVPTYNRVGIEVVGQPDEDGGTTMMQVTADIPDATDYKHIHFGVWAALGEAEKNGDQELSDLGIGFVQNFSGEGLTSIGGSRDDLPNTGTGTYIGNWVAAVQKADGDGDGAISLEHDTATLIANFGDGNITATLNDLATLSGKISEDTLNTFSGEKATVGMNAYGLTAEADFTGSFSGGFFGAAGAEAGGIFDFASDDDNDGANEGGAFRGSFGADKKLP